MSRPVGSAELAGERAVRRFVTVLAVVVGGLCFLFSAGNVYQLAVDLELWAWIRPLVAPAVDLSLVALVVGIRFLARRGLKGAELRRPRLFLLAVGLAAWALNTAGAVAQRDWGKAAFDSLAPGLLVGWSEVLPWFLRQFYAVTHPAEDPARARVPIPTEAEARPSPAGDTARAPSRARRPSRPSMRTGPAGSAELAERARTAAAAYEAEYGRPISRDALGRALHVGNRVAGELLRAVRAPVPPAGAVPPPARTPADPASLAAEAGPVPGAGPAAGNGRRPVPEDQATPVPSFPSRPPARVP